LIHEQRWAKTIEKSATTATATAIANQQPTPNNQHPTTGNQQQPLTATPINQQSALNNQQSATPNNKQLPPRYTSCKENKHSTTDNGSKKMRKFLNFDGK
jgi:hypothetical protein